MYEDNADSRMYENLFSILYDHHPVRKPIAGTVESIAAITPEILAECHRAFYDPANMMLSVVGPVDPEGVADIAGQLLPKRDSAVSVSRDYGPPESPVPKEGRREARMEVAMPGFTVGFPCAESANPLRQELAGDLAMELLVGESSALYTRLYEEGLIDSDFSAGCEGVKTLAMLTAGGDSKDPDRVCDAILEEAARIGREGADPQLFERLKRSAFGRRMRELDSFETICFRMCQSHFDGTEYYDFPDLYRAITQEEVENLLRTVVVPERAAVSLIYPKGRA